MLIDPQHLNPHRPHFLKTSKVPGKVRTDGQETHSTEADLHGGEEFEPRPPWAAEQLFLLSIMNDSCLSLDGLRGL